MPAIPRQHIDRLSISECEKFYDLKLYQHSFVGMEWTIPLQSFETSKIVVGSPSRGTKLISPLSYSDGETTFTSVAILLPMLPIKSYDATSGRLQIALQGAGVAKKLQEFQEMLINSVYTNQRTWFPGDRASEKDDIRQGFQPFVEHGALHLYCPTSAGGVSNEIHNYVEGKWSRGVISPAIFATGKMIRLAIKIQGLSFHQHPLSKAWTGKFRLQHRILAIMTS